MNGAHLVVRLGPQRVALPAAAIERVVRGLNILPLPGAAAATVGLAEFAGEPLAVVDLGHWLGVRRTRPASSGLTVVARLGDARAGERLGLAVDEVLEVTAVSAAPDPGQVLVRGHAIRRVDLAALSGAA
ncbi:MAG: chemotaxis protein CheW [Thermoanaerobaculia bacterium]